jgi:hypothetical protein
MGGFNVLATEADAAKVNVVAAGHWWNQKTDIVITRSKHHLGVRRNISGTVRVRSIPVLCIFERRTFVNVYYGEPLEPEIWPGFDRSKILDPRETAIRPGSYYRYGRGMTFYVVAIERCIGIFGKPSRRPWAVLQFEDGDLMTGSLQYLASIGLTREPN